MARSAGIYARISSDSAGTGAGVARQLKECRAFAKDRDLLVVREYQDNDVSAFSGKTRPSYEQMLEDLKGGVIACVIAWHPDRLHRSLKDLERFIDVVESTGAGVATVMAGDLDLATSEGRLMARVGATFARHESERKAERIRSKQLELAEAGRFHGGTRPFGYAADGITILDDEASLVREAAAQILRGISCRGIARDWNEREVKTPRGGSWAPQVIRKMLLAPRLAGLRQHRGAVVGSAAWPPILDRQTWHSVVATLTDPQRVTNGRINARRNVLAGFVRCGLCGGPLVTGRNNGKPAMKCERGRSPDSCGRISVMLEPLDALVREIVIERLMLAPSTLRKAARIQHNADKRAASVTADLDAHQARLAALEEAYAAGEVSLDDFKRTSTRIRRRQQSLLQQLATGRAAHTAMALPITSTGIAEAWDEGGLDQRRALLDLVLHRIEIRPAPYPGARFSSGRVRPVFRRWGS